MTAPARLVDAALAHARAHAAREAVVAGATRLTYANLATLAERTAAALTRAGLRPGARVAFLGGPGAAFLASQFATHLAGGVWLGLSPRHTAREHAHVLRDAAPSLVVVEPDSDAAALAAACAMVEQPPVAQHLARLDDLADVPGPLAAPAALLDPEVALLVYTSGTTGEPKGAMLTHAGIVAAARLYADRYGHPGLRALMNLPINHVGGLIDLTAPAMLTGGALVTMARFDPAATPGVLREERVTLFGQVPAMHLAVNAVRPFDPAAYPALRHLVWSGAPMPRAWIAERIGAPAELSTCYGLTETTGSVTFTAPGADVDTLAGTVGAPPRPGMVRIGPGGEGASEVEVRGPFLMAGYLGRADATAQAFTADGWLRTGDLGRLDDAGALRLVGRAKEMYKSGGFNVYPREIETALEEHPAIAAAAVIGVPDARWGETGWAFLLTRAALSEGEAAAHARARLAGYKLPSRWVIAPELPLLPIGKIDKRALAAAAAEGRYG